MLFQLDHQDSGFGKCEIVNKCTSEKNNTRAGYKLYAGKYTINWIQEISYKNIGWHKELNEIDFHWFW